MARIAAAARMEYAKLGRSLTTAELAGWAEPADHPTLSPQQQKRDPADKETSPAEPIDEIS
jgi:hypothetical protein